MTVCKENLPKKKKRIPELISEFNKVVEYKINTQKYVVFPYTSYEQLEIWRFMDNKLNRQNNFEKEE